jgi:hypothetical protein
LIVVKDFDLPPVPCCAHATWAGMTRREENNPKIPRWRHAMRAQPLVAAMCVVLTIGVGSARAQPPGRPVSPGQAAAAQIPAPVSAKTWPEGRTAIEEYLRTGEIVSVEEIPVGVTRPTRCAFAPGGPVAAMTWKPVRPGHRGGFWESYRSEIAAYELDKVLGLDMIPPTVEKRFKGDLGAAVMWVSPARTLRQLGGSPKPPPAEIPRWVRQISRAKLFDNLIANIDSNQGNWLVDPAWNVILIDHTRSFTTTKQIVHKVQRIDAELWQRMLQLTEASLQDAIGAWVGKAEIRAMLARRDNMQSEIQRRVRQSSEAAVFIR